MLLCIDRGATLKVLYILEYKQYWAQIFSRHYTQLLLNDTKFSKIYMEYFPCFRWLLNSDVWIEEPHSQLHNFRHIILQISEFGLQNYLLSY